MQNKYIFFGISAILAVTLVLAWFYPLNYHVFMGDDLSWIQFYNTNNYRSAPWIENIVMSFNSTKFRPVTNIFLVIETKTCHNVFDCFFAVNLIIFVFNVFLTSLCAYLITNKWRAGIYISSVIFILSRFSYYFVVQVMGEIESLAMTFMLLLILGIIYFFRKPEAKRMALVILLLLLTILSHERYIVLFVPVLFSLIIKKKYLKPSEFIFLLFSLLILLIAYILVKQYIFASPLLSGTGGTNVGNTFKISQFLAFVGNGILNLVGFNAGPDYLSGKYFLDAGAGGIIVGVFLLGTLTILTYSFIREWHKKHYPDFSLIVTLILIVGATMAAASVTIRQEYRWLYAPFTVFILLVCLMLSKLSSAKPRNLLALILTISFASVDIYYRQYISNVFFMDGLRTANSMKTEIIDKYAKSVLSQREIYILTGGNSVIQSWYLQGDYFFKLYSGIPGIKVHYADDLNAIPISDIEGTKSLVFQVDSTQVSRVPKKVIQEDLLNNVVPSGFDIEYDFIKDFSSGVLNDNGYVSTPTGKGVFLMNWQDDNGIVSESLTILSHFNIRFPAIICQSESKLVFRAGIPYTQSDGANLYIDLAAGQSQQKVADILLKPSAVNTVIAWNDYSLSLPACSGGKIDIIFGVSSPSGNPVADWVALTNVRLIAPNH